MHGQMHIPEAVADVQARGLGQAHIPEAVADVQARGLGQAHIPEAVADVQARGLTHATNDGPALAVPEKQHLDTKSSHPGR